MVENNYKRTYTLNTKGRRAAMEKIRNPLDHQFLFLIRKYHINGLEMRLHPKAWRDAGHSRHTRTNKRDIYCNNNALS